MKYAQMVGIATCGPARIIYAQMVGIATGSPARAPARGMPRPPFRAADVGTGRFARRDGVFRARQLRPTSAHLQGDDLGEHWTDCWVEHAPSRPGGRFGHPTRLAYHVRPAVLRGGRTDLRVDVPPLGGRVTFTRVLALAFLEYEGQAVTWAQLKEELRPGTYKLAVGHKDDNPLNCVLENLQVVPNEANEQQERKRAAAGRRPPRGTARDDHPKRGKKQPEEAGSAS